MLPSLATETAAGPLVIRAVVSNDSNAGTDTNFCRHHEFLKQSGTLGCIVGSLPLHINYFLPKISVPRSLWNILTCECPSSAWAGCSGDILIDEGNFCKCLCSFGE
ncbi:hypothetical protein ACRRTK_003017 [Alexandromys fortis]